MKKFLLLIPPLFATFAAAASQFPAFPAFDPFTNSSAAGGSGYAAGTALAGQTNAMGQYWYSIDSSGSAANEINLTGGSLSYQALPGFSGNTILLTNVSGPGARMFVATNASGFFSTGPLSIFYSLVLSVTNINNLSAAGDYCIGVNDQSSIGNQTSQPGTVAARLYFKKINSTGYEVGISKFGGSTNYVPAVFTTNQVLFVVVDYEIVTTIATSGTRDNVRLWVNPDPSTFGATAQPEESTNILATDTDITPYISAVEFHNRATDTPNDILLTDFRMGTNWSWVTGGPAIGQQPVAATNIPSGALTLSVTAMQNGTDNGYQWQWNGTNLSDGPSLSGSGATVSGSATSTLTVNNLAPADAGAYSVVVTNAYGAVTSSVSAVTAYSSPVVITQPTPTNLLLFAGESNVVSLAAVGAPPLSYFWYSNDVLVASVTGPSFTNYNVQTGFTLQCVVSNSLGTANSAPVSLSVVPQPSAPYPLAVFQDHPIGFWPLNEGPDDNAGDPGVTAYDYAGGNNGAYTNAILGQQGYAQGLAAEYGYATATDTNTSALFGVFASPDSYVGPIPNINFGSNTATSFTIEAWANGAGSARISGAGIVNKGFGNGGEQFTLDVDTTWRFYVRNAAGTAFTALSGVAVDSDWHHLAGVVDTVHSNVTIYVDGVARASTAFTASGGLLNTPDPVIIGSRKSSSIIAGYDNNFLGYVQDVAIYNYALSPQQVANHYYAAGVAPSALLPSSTNVNEGTTLVVTPAIAGTPPLVLQWYDESTGTPLAGQTNASLVISNITAAAYDGHSVALALTNQYGQSTSGSMLIQVASGPPNSVSIAPSAISVYQGVPVPFAVTAQGTLPYFYQWSVDGASIAGATNSTFTNAAAAGGPHTIACQVSNNIGPAPLATATLTVAPAPADYYGATILKDGPTAFWRLDEPASASVANDYVGGHNAAYDNAVNGVPGIRPLTIPAETATVFGTNGVNPSLAQEEDNTSEGIGLIDFSGAGANAEFTVEFWALSPSITGGDYICKGYPNNTQFAFDTGGGGGAPRFVVHNSSDAIYTVSTGTALDGNWHYLAGVCDQANGSLQLYLDGVLKATGTVPPGTGLLELSSLYPVIIAAQEAQNRNSYTSLTNTVLSQVALYPYALKSNQIAAHFAAAVEPLAVTVPAAVDLVAGVDGRLNAAVSGGVAPYTYQWRFNGVIIPGGTTNPLVLTNAGTAAAGSYDLIVSDSNYVAAVTSSVVAVTIVPELAFDGNGPGWQAQGSTLSWLGNDILQLTDSAGGEKNSAFYGSPVYVGGFRAGFTYQCVSGPANSGNGAAFLVQNDPRGAAAIGAGTAGGNLGLSGIEPSVELEFNIYASNNIGGVGISFNTNGTVGPVVSTAPLVLNSGDPVQVVLTYQDGTATVLLTDTNAGTSYTASANVDIPSLLGSSAGYVGFTAADGAPSSTQQISDFTFVSLVGLNLEAAGNSAVLSWPAGVGNFILQQNASLAGTNWVNVPNAVTRVNGQNQLTLPVTGHTVFYRLSLQ